MVLRSLCRKTVFDSFLQNQLLFEFPTHSEEFFPFLFFFFFLGGGPPKKERTKWVFVLVKRRGVATQKDEPPISSHRSGPFRSTLRPASVRGFGRSSWRGWGRLLSGRGGAGSKKSLPSPASPVFDFVVCRRPWDLLGNEGEVRRGGVESCERKAPAWEVSFMFLFFVALENLEFEISHFRSSLPLVSCYSFAPDFPSPSFGNPFGLIGFAVSS